MSAEEALRSNEEAALQNNQIISSVTGTNSKKGSKRFKRSFGAAAFITAMIVVFAVFFSSGNMIPSAISERLIEETDVQYADAIESKILVFQQALYSGDVPDNTTEKLKLNGVLVGYIDGGEFREANKTNTSLSLKISDEIVSAEDFPEKINNDAMLYKAFNEATYSRAAYYYDKSATSVFKKMGISRNNFSGEEDFDEVMEKIVGEGSSIDVNSVGLYEKENEMTKEKYYEYGEVGQNTGFSEAAAFVENVKNKTQNTSSDQATLDAASSLNTADTISKEQKSSLFFVAFMENISKMKAGLGNESRINEAMNYLYKNEKSEVVDVKTGEVVEVEGSMLESHSLYSILSGERVNVDVVEDYSSDRILKTVENQMGVSDSSGAINSTVASSARGIKGTIGRLINWGKTALSSVLSKVTPTIKNSLIDNGFNNIKGVAGGELLAEGAVNVGKELAKASGATAGDATAVKTYARLNNSILALEAEADRLNRSPFDITSKNTFLGSIMYKLAISSIKRGSFMKSMASFSKTVASSFSALLPTSFAEDNENSFLTNFGNCETLGTIGAVGSAGCSMIATFDTTTLNNIYNDASFISFVEANTVLDNGVRIIKDNSELAKFIIYNDERITPVGIVDGGILESVSSGSSSVSFVTNILNMIKTFLGANNSAKRVASGEAFLNSSSNNDWEIYKYAQRYVSLARAQESLRQYDGDKAAYSNIRFFEGTENPVVAFIKHYNSVANN